jgi:hypothetical protein
VDGNVQLGATLADLDEIGVDEATPSIRSQRNQRLPDTGEHPAIWWWHISSARGRASTEVAEVRILKA